MTAPNTFTTGTDVAQIGLPEPFCGRWINFVRTASDPDWSREYQPDDRQ